MWRWVAVARTPTGTSDPWSRAHEPAPSTVDFAIIIGRVTAAFGLGFLAFFFVLDVTVGEIAGADLEVGVVLSAIVLLFGVALATILWVGRELVGAGATVADRARAR